MRVRVVWLLRESLLEQAHDVLPAPGGRVSLGLQQKEIGIVSEFWRERRDQLERELRVLCHQLFELLEGAHLGILWHVFLQLLFQFTGLRR